MFDICNLISVLTSSISDGHNPYGSDER